MFNKLICVLYREIMSASKRGVTCMYMCKICNLFSPRKKDLLSHATDLHNSEGINPDDVIIPLKPLPRQRPKPSSDAPKKKRGRPKDATTTTFASIEVVVSSDGERQKEQQNPGAETKGECPEDDSLECKKCNRKFSNKRQISKHICYVETKEDNDNDPPYSEGALLETDSEDSTVGVKTSEKTNTSQTPKRARTQIVQKQSGKESEAATGPLNPIVSVRLAAHEAIPDATKIVPIEASPADAVAADADPTTQDKSPKKGFQEYAIQQASYEVPLTSNRVGTTQLKIFTCEYCNKVFKFKHSLQAHLRIHTKEKPFKCPQCDYASAIKANLNVHMRKHTGEKFSCEHCSFTCLSKGHLKVHVERVHEKIKRHCRFCKKKYSDIKNLLKHIREAHDMEDRKVKSIYDEYRLQTREGKRQLLYDCNICERKFKNELHRDRHMMIHATTKPYGCELCDHGSTKLQALQVHIRKHPFIYGCAVCPQKFVSTTQLKKHLVESHPDMEESEVFPKCIQNSFCLLKPGDDIQHQMLRQDDLQITEELSLLNVPSEALIPEGQESQAHGKGGGSCEQEAVITLEIIDKETLPKELEGQTVVNSVNASTDVLPAPLENCSGTNEEVPCGSQSSQSADGEASSQETSHYESSEENNEKLDWGVNVEMTPFKQIIDQMQKKRLSMELFKRIKKVYGELECEYCGKLYWYQVHYDTHVRTHTREYLHNCTECTYSSITKTGLKRHIVQKHSNVLLKCPQEGCEFVTPDKYKLNAHCVAHSEKDKEVVTCPFCEKTVAEEKMKQHLQSSHPDIALDSTLEALGITTVAQKWGKKTAKCPYCDRYFKRVGADLQRHIWTHEGVKPFKCSVCDFAARTKSNLTAHMNRHSTEKTHLCDLCGKKFKSKCSLKAHKLLHTTEVGKKFKCTECDYMTVQKPQLVRHMEQHAPFKPFKCAHCHYSCNMAGSLKRHYHRKHPNEEYSNAGSGMASDSVAEQGGHKCPVCNYAYGTKWEMNRHLKNKHRLKVVESDGLELDQWVDQVVESLEEEEESTQFLHIAEAEDSQATEEAVTTLQDLHFTTENGVVSATSTDELDPAAVNILQQIIELGSENTDGTVASVVAMAPGTVTVLEQVAEEEQQSDHTMIIQDALQQASVEMGEEHHLVVSSDDMEGIKTVTVYTQGEEASQYIVYVQTDEQMTEAL